MGGGLRGVGGGRGSETTAKGTGLAETFWSSCHILHYHMVLRTTSVHATDVMKDCTTPRDLTITDSDETWRTKQNGHLLFCRVRTAGGEFLKLCAPDEILFRSGCRSGSVVFHGQQSSAPPPHEFSSSLTEMLLLLRRRRQGLHDSPQLVGRPRSATRRRPSQLCGQRLHRPPIPVAQQLAASSV